MRHLLVLLLLPFLALAAVHANATSECASALQLQNTVRSSLRSKANEFGIRELKTWAAEQKASMDKAVVTLEKAVVEQKNFAEKAVAEQKNFAEKAVAEQKSIAEKAVTAALMANNEIKMILGFALTFLFSGFAFFVFTPQRAVAMLRAYIGLQHAPP